MSATEKISLDNIKKLGIIAGSGTLPRDLLQRAQARNIECHVIGFKPHTNYVTPDLWGEVGRASKILDYLKQHDIQDIVFIGGIKKPSFKSLRPDWVTLKFFITTWWHSMGDSNVLTSARNILEKMNFKLIGIHYFLPELLMDSGALGAFEPTQERQKDIQLGLNEAYALGERDEGQAVLVNGGQVLAYEDKHGTNHMIAEHGQKDAILVKLCKPQQDHDLDLPTIGPKTLALCAEKQMAGVIGHAAKMLIAERQEVIRLADKHGLFVWGYDDHA